MNCSRHFLHLRKNTILLHHAAVNNRIGEPFVELLSVDSTNNYAIEMIHNSKPTHGTVYFAYQQFAGKGQRGKQWQTHPGENITMSAVLDTSLLQVSHLFALSVSMALGCYDFFKSYAPLNLSLKWPNDLYHNDRKAGGVLIENIIRGKDWQNAVAGIGLNINQTYFDPTIVNPVSLKQITCRTYEIVPLAKELCAFLEKRFNQLLQGEIAVLLQEYNAVLYRHGEVVKFKKDNVVFEGVVRKVNSSGQLIIDAGIEQAFEVGEIEWLIS
jgi:BirA family biotin operon repressor/biotin-[acetyl-CoA-carboxylase] ligase